MGIVREYRIVYGDKPVVVWLDNIASCDEAQQELERIGPSHQCRIEERTIVTGPWETPPIEVAKPSVITFGTRVDVRIGIDWCPGTVEEIYGWGPAPKRFVVRLDGHYGVYGDTVSVPRYSIRLAESDATP